MMRRAFSLIELTLATAVGVIVVGACVSIFAVLAKSDQSHAVRAREIDQLQRTQTIVQRALMSIAVEHLSAAAVASAAGNNPAGAAGQDAKIRPRLLLEPDASLHRHSMKRDTTGAQVVVVGKDLTPQRFELVVTRPPVGEPVRIEASWLPPGVAIMEGATRGAFELIPSTPSRGQRPAWTLTWRTYPPIVTPGLDVAVPIQPPAPIVLAENLKYVRWQVFHKFERLTEYEVTPWESLPAYIELDMTTASGVEVSWMFEIVVRHMAERRFASTLEAAAGGEAPPAQQPRGGSPSRARPTTPRPTTVQPNPDGPSSES